MRAHRFQFLALFVVTLLASACNSANSPVPSITPAGSTSMRTDYSLLLAVKGDLTLKREGWTDYHSTAFGAIIHHGDLLYPSAGAEAVILCADLTVSRIPPGVPVGILQHCQPPPEPILRRGESNIGQTRSVVDTGIPFIITPRKTRLLESPVALRWNDIVGANSYDVLLRNLSTGETLWETSVSTAEAIFPGFPYLESDVSYLVVVTADDGTSSLDEVAPGLGFTVLDDEEVLQLEGRASQLDDLGLDPEAEALARAHLYASSELNDAAIRTLEDAIANGAEHAAVYRLLGVIYQKVGLYPLAEDPFQAALSLSTHSGDVEGMAEAYRGLAFVQAAVGNPQEAQDTFSEALGLYNQLGDARMLAEIEAEIDRLND